MTNIWNKGLLALALIMSLCFGIAQPASAQSFNAGNAMVTGIGDQINSGFDKLVFTGIAGAFLPGPNLIGTLEYIVDGNCTTCDPASGILSFLMTVGANAPQSVIVPYAWSSTGPTDTIALTWPAPLNFGGDTLLVTGPSGFSIGNGTISGSVYGALTQVSNAVDTPEPASMALLGASLGILGMVRRRRASNAEPGASLATR